ncbi:MAG: Lar family restriction alleviation protein [Myxococcales bacterium]|jgi:Lar family restriction alleviation protein|nr:Lar family restriction alleviation protein [Myxococcales bacterium]
MEWIDIPLKDCPFCGSQKEKVMEEKNGPYIWCQSCGARAGETGSLLDAVVHWNHRISELAGKKGGGSSRSAARGA